jgi:hypothetical protein
MEISYKVLYNVFKMIISLSQGSPLKKISKQEYEMANYILSSASSESNYRECLNRALTHLESAFVHFIPTITTWDIWDRDRVLWSKRTYANGICVRIAIIHFILGNNSVAKKWLIDNLNDMGSIYFPNEILDCLQICDSESFYRDVFQSDYPQIASLLKESERNYDSVYSDNDSDDIPYWCHYD